MELKFKLSAVSQFEKRKLSLFFFRFSEEIACARAKWESDCSFFVGGREMIHSFALLEGLSQEQFQG